MGAAYAAVEPASESPEQPFYHESILLDEVVQFLQPVAGKLMADGTLGGGGHTEALLKAGATVKGIDRDADARAYANERLARFGDRFEAVEGRFGDIATLAEVRGWEGLDGILLDWTMEWCWVLLPWQVGASAIRRWQCQVESNALWKL